MASYVTNEAALRMVHGGSATQLNWDTASTIKMRLIGADVTPDKDDVNLTGRAAMAKAGGGTVDDVAVSASNTTITKNTTSDKIQFKYDHGSGTPVEFTNCAGNVGGGAAYTPKWICFFYNDGSVDVPICYVDLGSQSAFTTTTTLQANWSSQSFVIMELAQ